MTSVKKYIRITNIIKRRIHIFRQNEVQLKIEKKKNPNRM